MKLPQWAISELIHIIQEHGSGKGRGWKNARNYLGPLCEKLGHDITQNQVYDAIHDINCNDRIAHCGKIKKFHSLSKGYLFCGTQKNCSCALSYTVGKRKKTMQERHGVEHALKSPEFINKARKTTKENWGVDHPMHSQEIKNKNSILVMNRTKEKREAIKQKTEATNMCRYGASNPMKTAQGREKFRASMNKNHQVDYPLQSRLIKKKYKETMRERYGAECPLKIEKFREKFRNTCKFRYGADHPLSSEVIKNKVKDTNIKRYGVESNFGRKDIQEAIRNTNIEKYGVDNPSKNSDIIKKIKKINLEKYYSDDISKILSNRDELEKYLVGKTFSQVANEWNMGINILLKHWRGLGIPTPKSRYEEEISFFLNILGITHVTNTRSIIQGMELDFYLPDYKLAIEFNGLYWHSTAVQQDTQYHRRKYQECRNLGIRLLMINEDEWLRSGQAWRNRIANIVNLSPIGVGARKLSISEISQNTANNFCDEHHIRGKTNSVLYAFGGFYEDDLVSIMVFNKQRGTGDIELVRYCTNGGNYPGIFSRLFAFAIKQYCIRDVISFADLRHSQGSLYLNNGFNFVHEIPPDYQYVYRDKTYHKGSFTKDQINKMFGPQYAGLTERGAMTILNIPRIYDCGKLKFQWSAK